MKNKNKLEKYIIDSLLPKIKKNDVFSKSWKQNQNLKIDWKKNSLLKWHFLWIFSVTIEKIHFLKIPLSICSTGRMNS